MISPQDPVGTVAVLGAAGPGDIPGARWPEPDRLLFAPSLAALGDALPTIEAVFAWNRVAGITDGFDGARSLRWIQAPSAGVDALLFPALVASDVVVTNARGVFDEPMAESVMAFVLALNTGILRDQRRGWSRDGEDADAPPRRRVAGERMLVVGAGSIGRAIGRAAGALGMTVSGVASRARPGDDVFEEVRSADALLELLPSFDVVVNVLPLTPATFHRFGAEAFGAMSADALFVNVGRGATVDEPALIHALETGQIRGAALDVFEVEPLPPASPLWDLENVIVSPHVAGDAEGWERRVVDVFADNLARFRDGRPLRGVVDKALGYVPT